MKKSIMVFVLCILTACSGTATKDKANEHEQKTTKKGLEYFNVSEGFGTNRGYYEIRMRDLKDGSTIQNIYYYDYDSKQEIFLCDKPECTHEDDSCTSFIPMETRSTLFVLNERLYKVVNSITGYSFGADEMSGEQDNNASAIYEMDLDGKNKKQISALDNGFHFDPMTIIIDGKNLYIIAYKEENISLGGNSTMAINTEKYLYKVDLKTGKYENIIDMKDKFFVLANGNQLLFQQLHYAQDPDALLNEKNYEAYDNVVMNASTSYSLYDVETKDLVEGILKGETYPLFDGKYFYYLNHENQLCSKSLESGNVTVLEDLEAGYSYVLDSKIRDGHFFVEVWEGKRDDPAYIKSYVYSLDDKTLQEFPLNFHEPLGPLRILGESDKQYFMNYKQEGQMETTWAGTQQFSANRKYYGLIQKDNFWKGLDRFEPVTALKE